MSFASLAELRDWESLQSPPVLHNLNVSLISIAVLMIEYHAIDQNTIAC
jgi:hypothetical protein